MTDRERLLEVSKKLLAISREVANEFPSRGQIARNIQQVVRDIHGHIEEKHKEND